MNHLIEAVRQIRGTSTAQVKDAELVLVAYGYTARVSKEAVNAARSEGLRVGLIRPITLYPFPYQAIREKANQGAAFLVVEDSLFGGLIADVKLAVEGRVPVHFLGVFGRHLPTDAGMILPERVLEEIRRLMRGDKQHG